MNDNCSDVSSTLTETICGRRGVTDYLANDNNTKDMGKRGWDSLDRRLLKHPEVAKP